MSTATSLATLRTVEPTVRTSGRTKKRFVTTGNNLGRMSEIKPMPDRFSKTG